MKSKLKKKTYNLITHPDLPGYYIENHGDRDFLLFGRFVNGYTKKSGAWKGDPNWDITDERILEIANWILEDEIRVLKEEQKKEKAKKEVVPFFKRILGLS